ncbi:MAG: thiamine pyrophosphate-binding protein [Burkholderiaceae bacterium]
MSSQSTTPSHGVTNNVADALVRAFKATGTQRMFGLPGGGSSLDLIRAGQDQGLPFVLARHECAAAMMAATTAELDGSIGVAIVTKGPGTANAANGVAHAALDRCALAMITDGFADSLRSYVTHQWYDQQQFLGPLVKAHSTLIETNVSQIESLVAQALAPRRGPVHLELTGAAARASLTSPATGTPPQAAASATVIGAPDPEGLITDLKAAKKLIRYARKPVIVVGLEARDAATTAAVRQWASSLGCPALVTYKAKGVIADNNPAYAGIFTGGAAEQPVVNEADLIVLVGVDPVELILQPWPYQTTVLELSLTQHPVHYTTPACLVTGDLSHSVNALAAESKQSRWRASKIKQLRKAAIKALGYPKVDYGLSPEQVVTVADKQAAALPVRPRVTVDAGAHMFSATSFWPCNEPNDLLISNGLASMGFALPAAIAAALHEPQRPVIAFTGDGGLLMCLGELATAAEQQVKVITIVFNDGALSLIDIKQQQRELASDGVRWPRLDFAGVMKSLGGQGYRVRTASSYRAALKRAFAYDGPSVIDVIVDPSGYPAQLRALRG